MKITKFIKNEKGQALVLVAISMSVLLGFSALVTDFGYVFLKKRDLQNAADAAALAAATQLTSTAPYNQDGVTATAENYSQKNNFQGTVNTFIGGSGTEVTVELSESYPRFLGEVISSGSYRVSVNSTATKASIWGNVRPFSPLPPNYTDIITGVGNGEPLLDSDDYTRLKEKSKANVSLDYNGSYENRLEDFRSSINIGAGLGIVAGSSRSVGSNYGFLDLRENTDSSAGASDLAGWLYYGCPEFNGDAGFNTSQPGNIDSLFSGYGWVDGYSPVDYIIQKENGIYYVILPHPSVDMSSPHSSIESKDFLIAKVQSDLYNYDYGSNYRLVGEVLDIINPMTSEGQTAGFNAGVLMNKAFITK